MPPQPNPELPKPPAAIPQQQTRSDTVQQAQPNQQELHSAHKVLGVLGAIYPLAGLFGRQPYDNTVDVNNPEGQRVLRMALGFIGVIFLLLGFLFFKTSQIPASYIHTEGVVVGIVNSFSSDGTRMYSPVFQFQSKDGQAHEFKDSSSSSSSPTVGSVSIVAYNPNEPDRNPMNVSSSKWTSIAGAVAMVVGGLLLLGGLLLFIKAYRSV